ncbi:polyprenyl diphosphate synthase [Streptomyces sp. 891-h]|uniref:polyprenyl diphosphate synthase n=1 Tax=Streptomyces sp. 891-h TaxID=2720714 RepID=UPI001FA99B33|nr:polyprenyl diphosphate synthase [Streptomyces sp. 891-h]UNZ15928.1 di-trans,poly-cis-decaprenylcistransferase [Streptomyces sp. 891-h]
MAPGTPPRHIACIMDGNGRWAQQRGLERTHGHMAALAALNAVVSGALREGVEWLTLFAFSTENWSRPEGEVSFLVDSFPGHVLEREARRLQERGVRLRLLGWDDPRIPADVTDMLHGLEELTRGNTKLQVSLAFNYGGRQDVCETVRCLAAQRFPHEEITEETFARHMKLPELPDVDLLLRTGGEHRLSNFLLWHCAYAELVFLDVLWPDFRAPHFQHALELYRQRRRRFGALGPAAGTDSPGPADADPAQPPVTGHPVEPGPVSPLKLPAAIASHLGSSLLNGVKETARFAMLQLGAASVQARRPDQR